MEKKKILAVRKSLTNDELWRLTADDFLRLKLTDDERVRLKEINKEKERERTERLEKLKIEEGPMLAELRYAGWDVKSVWDLVNTKSSYSEAIPILLKHLLLPYSDRTREGIGRALAVSEPEVHKAWPILIEEYRKAPMGWGIKAPGDVKEYRFGAKDGLACALAASVTDERLPELIALAKDRSYGESRVLLLSALRKRRNKNPQAKQAIDELANDPELQKEIASWGAR